MPGVNPYAYRWVGGGGGGTAPNSLPFFFPQPLGRMGQPAEVAAAAVFLASEATFCTGLELLVTGGAELGYGRKASKSSLREVPTLPSNVH